MKPASGRVLFISPLTLWPTVGGSRLRSAMPLVRALDEMLIDLVVVAPPDDVVRDASAAPALPGLTVHLFPNEAPDRPAPARISRVAAELIGELVRSNAYDAVHVEGHYLLHLVPPEALDRTVVVEHNVESQLLEQRAALGDLISLDDIRALQRAEERAWRRARAVVALSPEDAAEMRRRASVSPHLIPNGWDHLSSPSRLLPGDERPLTSPRLLFLANYDYAPNRDALVWLVEDIFPVVQERIDGACLVLAGGNLPPDLDALASHQPSVELLGYVDDLEEELDRADIVLCPLRIGGGVKVKVTEAIRRARLLVSTTVGGIQGIPSPLRSGVCFADDAGTFAGHVVRLCLSPAERRDRRERLLANQWAIPTWDECCRRTVQLWSQVSPWL